MRAREREGERSKVFSGCTAIVNPLGSFASFEIILMRANVLHCSINAEFSKKACSTTVIRYDNSFL